MKSKRIFNIETRMHPDGVGAKASCRMNHQVGPAAAKTAIVKAMMFINEYCDCQKLGIFLVINDETTKLPLDVKLSGLRVQ